MKKFLAPLLLGTLGGCAANVADGPRYLNAIGPVGDYALTMQSMQDRRFAGVIRQKYDFSCGSAALATLLRHHYDYAVGEENAFRGMWAHGDRDQIRRLGFSLLDMKRWLATRGITADGYRVSMNDVAATGIPGVALISIKGYRHFVVVKGVTASEVLLGDPSTGLGVMRRADFEAAWNGIYFVIADDQARGKTRFNQSGQWAEFPRAPLGPNRGRLGDPVSQQALMLTVPVIVTYGSVL